MWDHAIRPGKGGSKGGIFFQPESLLQLLAWISQYEPRMRTGVTDPQYRRFYPYSAGPSSLESVPHGSSSAITPISIHCCSSCPWHGDICSQIVD